MELTDEEKREREQAEEDRLLSRLNKTDARIAAKKAPQATQEQPVFKVPVAQRVELGKGAIQVQLVAQNDHNDIYQTETVTTKDGRIPIADLEERWRIKNPMWADLGVPIGKHKDGYSDKGFSGMKYLKISGTRV
eukprot:TRINITY_DN1201_c0_g1_i1.p1 TRINITY_DN1201_c0_g1~~TRINITY_DN1201_c0_g1_i1.p1  ORF type:complete len:135 (-),score=38.06 TRINITY_DN1201_c0_g1_i1:158-562(-)